MNLLLSPICTLCVCSILIGCSQESLIFYPETLPPDYPFAFSGPFEEMAVPVEAAALNALLFKVPNPKGGVLYFHGNAGSLRTWGDVANEFTTRGYDVVMPDYRGYGKSTAKIRSEDMLHRDAAFAYRYLREHYQENEIVIYGRSLGSGLGVYLAKSSNPRMLILESPFFSFREVAKYHYPFLPDFFFNRILRYQIRSDVWISEVRCPVYLMHGTKDEIVPYESSIKLLKLIKKAGKLITVEGGGHNDISDFKVYQDQLDQILK